MEGSVSLDLESGEKIQNHGKYIQERKREIDHYSHLYHHLMFRTRIRVLLFLLCLKLFRNQVFLLT